MYYLKFVRNNGVEYNLSCQSFTLQPRDGWSFVSANIRDVKGHYEINICVGGSEETHYHSMFVMNINGQTLDKITTPTK